MSDSNLLDPDQLIGHLRPFQPNLPASNRDFTDHKTDTWYFYDLTWNWDTTLSRQTYDDSQ